MLFLKFKQISPTSRSLLGISTHLKYLKQQRNKTQPFYVPEINTIAHSQQHRIILNEIHSAKTNIMNLLISNYITLDTRKIHKYKETSHNLLITDLMQKISKTEEYKKQCLYS